MEVRNSYKLIHIDREDQMLFSHILVPQCNPSIFGLALLPSNATRQESVPKDYMNWASITGI